MEPLADGSLLYSVETYLRPPYFSRYEERASRASESKLAQTSPVSFADTEVLREFASSKDGTAIPLNIVRRKGTKLTGSNPPAIECLRRLRHQPDAGIPRRQCAPVARWD